MNKDENIEVFTVSVSYPYREDDGMMVETSLNQEFLADNPSKAIDIGVAWAKNRFRSVYKEFYKESFIGCIKIGTRIIGTGQGDGFIDTRRGMCFFEWKYDQYQTLESYIKGVKGMFK